MIMPPPSKLLSMAMRPITTIYPKLWFTKIPEPARFVTSAGLGNIIFFYIDIIMYDLVVYPLSMHDFDLLSSSGGIGGSGISSSKHSAATMKYNKKTNAIAMSVQKILVFLLPPKSVLQKNRESISFFASYLIQIVAQHFLNAFFVYGLESISTKDKYMSSLFVTYSSYFVSLIGSTICNIMLLRKGMSKNVAFWGTVFGFGFFNYIALKFLIGNNSNGSSGSSNSIGKQKDNDTITDKRDGGRAKKFSSDRNNNNNNSKNNRTGGRNKNDTKNKNSTTNKWRSNITTRKMRGGGQIYNDGQSQGLLGQGQGQKQDYVNTIMTQILNEMNSFVDGLAANLNLSSYEYDHHMVFVKSVGRGIELGRQKM